MVSYLSSCPWQCSVRDMERDVRYFVRSGDGEPPSYIATQNRLTITRDAFTAPEFSVLVEMVRESVEALCRSRPDDRLDRIVICLDYGVTQAKE